MTLTNKSEGIYVDESTIPQLQTLDGIIFDCDGVLIDITKSYDLAIIQTTNYVLKKFADIDDAIDINFEIIDGFKATGGFNDEVDLTYAAIISLYAAKYLEKDQNDFIFDVIKNADSKGIVTVEKYLESICDISEIKEKLSYPGTHDENILYRIFDQIFYGPQLYADLFGKTSDFSESGLIEQDKVILTLSLLEKLDSKFKNKIGMVTGRGKKSVGYSLKELLEKFDIQNSKFLEDESRELAKPNPKPLQDCISGMNCSATMYVGDSMEDFIMAKKVSEIGFPTIFCGIIGTSKNPKEKLRLFEENGAILVLDSIDFIPKVLNLE